MHIWNFYSFGDRVFQLLRNFEWDLVFFGPIGKTRLPPWPLIDWDIFDFSSESAERNLTNLDSKQDPNVLSQICVFGPIGKTRWPPWPLIGGKFFNFSETAQRNSTKLDRKQDGRGRWDLAPCQVSLNLVRRFQRRSRKCLSQSEARATILFFGSARKTQTW